MRNPSLSACSIMTRRQLCRRDYLACRGFQDEKLSCVRSEIKVRSDDSHRLDFLPIGFCQRARFLGAAIQVDGINLLILRTTLKRTTVPNGADEPPEVPSKFSRSVPVSGP